MEHLYIRREKRHQVSVQPPPARLHLPLDFRYGVSCLMFSRFLAVMGLFMDVEKKRGAAIGEVMPPGIPRSAYVFKSLQSRKMRKQGMGATGNATSAAGEESPLTKYREDKMESSHNGTRHSNS